MTSETTSDRPGLLPRRSGVRLAVLGGTLGAGALAGVLARSVLLGLAVALLVLAAQLLARVLRPRLLQAVAERRGAQPQALERLRLRLGDVPLPRLGGWAADPDFLHVVLDEIEAHRPRRILELGSGSSTVVLATAARRSCDSGCDVVSLEQDAEHARRTREELARRGLDATVRHAAVRRPTPEARPWYDEAVLGEVAADGKFDLVVVDGPSTATDSEARAPTVERLRPHLAERATIVLDDAGRDAERAMLDEAAARGLLEGFERRDVATAKGASVLRREPPRA